MGRDGDIGGHSLGNLSPVGWAGMSLVGDMFIRSAGFFLSYFVPLSFCLPAM